MNLLELRTALKRYGFDDDDPIDIWINAARYEIHVELDWAFLEDFVQINAQSGESDLSAYLPADFFKVRSLVQENVGNGTSSNHLDYIEHREWRRRISDPGSQGNPSAFTLMGLNKLYVWPTPQASASYNLLYQKALAELTGNLDEPEEFHPMFHYVIVFRSAAIALMAENEEERSQTAMTEYTVGLERMLRAYVTREQDQFSTVTDAQEYGG